MNKWGLMLLRGTVGVMLLASAFVHLANPYFFLSSIYAFDLTTPWLGEVAAVVLPWVQLTAAIMLWLSPWRTAGYLISAVLFAFFSIVQASALLRDLTISCGCFGSQFSEHVSGSSLSQVLACVVLAGMGLRWDRATPARGDIHDPATA